jgi:WD40 repeat protein
VIALGQRGSAVRQSRLAFARELAAAAQANLDVDPERSILLAMQAVEATRTDGLVLRQAVDALHAAIAADRLLFTITDPSTGNVLWSPDGNLIATGGSVGGNAVSDVVLWNARTGEEIRRLSGHEGDIESITFSNDASRLVSTSADQTAKVWDVESGTEIRSFSADEHEHLPGASFSPDGRQLVLGTGCCLDGEPHSTAMRVIDTSTWRVDRTLPAHPREWSAAAPSYSPDGTKVVAETAVWDVETGRRLVEMPGEQGIWRPDGAAVAQYDPGTGGVVMADATDGSVLDRLAVPGGVTGFAWSPDATLFATGGYDGIARVFDTGSGAELLTLAGHKGLVGLVSFSSDGTRLVTGGGDGTARVWDVSPEGAAEVGAAAYNGWIGDVEYAPDGETVFTAGFDGGWIWDASTLERVEVLPDANVAIVPAPDGSMLVTAGWPDGGEVRIQDAATGETRATLPSATEVDLSPDGSMLMTADFGPVVRLWETATGRRFGAPLRDPGAPLESSEGIAFSPDGSRFAVLDGRATVRVWRTDDRSLIAKWQANSGIGRTLAWDPRGGLLVTGGADGAVVWGGPAFERIRTLPGGGLVNDLAFNADGTRMATVSDAGTITIWDTQSWQEILIMPTRDHLLSGVAFAPDGDSLATVSESGELRVYTLDLTRLLTIAARRLSRPLTDEECRLYLHGPCAPGALAIAEPGVSEHGQATELDGAYHVSITESEGAAAGLDREVAYWSQGSYTLMLLDGRYRLTQDDPWDRGRTSWGTYEVTDERLVLTQVSDARCTGVRYGIAWRRHGASLTLGRLEVTDTETCPDDGWAALVFTSEPWTRLGESAA